MKAKAHTGSVSDRGTKKQRKFPLFTVLFSFLWLWVFYIWEPRIPFADNLFCLIIGTFYKIYGELHTAGNNPDHIDSFRFLANLANNITFSSRHMVINHDIFIPRPEGLGTGSINVVTMRPKVVPKDEVLPLVLWFHGGGMVVGKAIDGMIPMNMLHHMNVTIVSVNYRLAPEHPFPAAYHDALSVMKYFATNPEAARIIGADASSIVVAGESAGGNLAAGTAQAARDLGIPIKFQALFIPMLRYESDTPSYVENANCPILSAKTTRWFWDKYVPDPTQCRNSSKCQPFLGDVNDLAPALVYTASCDPFRDEGFQYAQRLKRANVSTEYIAAHGSHFGVTMFEQHHLSDAFQIIGDALGIKVNVFAQTRV